ncbi:MAG TPA: peptidoglycan-binding protein [Acidimicrobiales bacterium]|nr:peptidoglycan-binding protein [Acidimicrobiales bacterium]
MTTETPTPSPRRRFRRPRWLASRRRQVVAGTVLLVVAGLILLGVTDPFASPPRTGVADNSYPTATATVTQQSLSSQNQESATLGYAGSYTVAVPTGTSAAAVTAAQSMVQTANAQVASARTALRNAEATATPTNASTLAAARNTVAVDATALSHATAQLAVDENLGCPASSAVTVTSPVSGGSAPPSPSVRSSSLSNGPSMNAAGSNGGSTSGSNGPEPLTPPPAGAPSATTGPVDSIRSTSATLTGSVNPNGAETTYYFEYGTSPNYGQTTPSTTAGAGTNDVPVTLALIGLVPGEAYHFRLVATNALGTAYGQDATFQTSAAPSVTVGPATSVSSTSESLSGMINPNGADTSYYFEYGTSASFGQTSPVVDLGGGLSPSSVTATITGLTAGATYDYALVATNVLGNVVSATSTFQGAASSCVSEHTVIAQDTLALSEARDALRLDELGQGTQVRAAEATLVSDEATAATDQSALAADVTNVTNANTTFTELPRVGARLHRGQSVYRLNNQPVPLFYGPMPIYRALYLGVSSGPDVLELNQNLIALGFEHGVASDYFTSSSAAAVAAWQGSLGEPATGIVALGDVVVAPGPLQVATVSAAKGQIASGGMAVLSATSRTPVVTIDLAAAQQSEVKVGDPVTITLPNNSTTPGVITSVGTVAVTPPSSSGNSSGPTITVIVTPTKLSAIGNLDQAPVNVSITNATVTSVLTVPVDALLALANGGYAVEEVTSTGVHQLVPVTLGLFDDAAGRVQVSGSGLAAGQKVVVPKL